MAEYIEREALIRRIKEIHCAECDSYHGVRCRACWVDDTLDYIDSEPASDVAPVRHGLWVSVPHKLARVCSVCNRDEPYKFADIDAEVYDYCPNCGAKMGGGVE